MTPLFRTVFVLMLLCGLVLPTHAQHLAGYPDLSLNGFGWSLGPFRDNNERLSSSIDNGQGLLVSVGTFGLADSRCAVVRQRQSTFNGGSTLALDSVTGESCSKVLALADGTFRIMGTAIEASGRVSGLIVALDTDGQLDTTFHDQGLLTVNALIPWLDADERTLLTSGMVDAQGRLLVVGQVINFVTGNRRGLLMRFLADGTLDTGFGIGGSLPLADYNPPFVLPSSVATGPDGLVYVAGFTRNTGFPDVGVIFRLLDDGQADLTFGAGMDAVARTGGGGRGFFNQCSRTRDLSVDPQGRMTMACEPDTTGTIPGPLVPPGVLRLGANGQPDPTFGGGDGYVVFLPFGSPTGSVGLPRIAVGASGRIVMGATLFRITTDPDPQDILVTRLNSDGSTDFGFGASGFQQSNYTVSPWQNSDFKAEDLIELRIDARDRVVLTGSYADQGDVTATQYGLLARLGMADPEVNAGFLDPDFAARGYRIERINEVAGARRAMLASDLAIDTQGRSILVGDLYLETNPVSTVCGVSRYLPTGQPDTAFSGNGQRPISLVAGGTTFCTSLAALPNGQILVAGFLPLSGNNLTGTVVRLQSDGTLDTQFFGNGYLDTWDDLGLSTHQISARFIDMVVDAQGGVLLLAAGRAAAPQNSTLRCGFGLANDECAMIIRLLPDGSLDTAFANNGIRMLLSPTNPSRMTPQSIAVDTQGRHLVVAGQGSTASDFAGVMFDSAPDGLSGQLIDLRTQSSCVSSTFVTVDAGNARLLDCNRSNGTSHVLRLLPGGNFPDLNFGLGGSAAIDFYTNGSGDVANVGTILPQSDNSIIVVGRHNQPPLWEPVFGRNDIGVAKLDPLGVQLPFGAAYGDLFRFPTYPGTFDETPAAAAMQADGRIVIAGTKTDLRAGVPATDNTEMFVFRIGNPQPVPLADPLFDNGFE
ncbi:MAG: hypothetical protein IPK97_18740 [Ahniella sp.]|nr:hypothetical protein [Ahniella sp.]